MMTIEERANDYAETRCVNVESNIHKRLLMDAFGSSYIQGAEEQRKIDFDKACDWLKTNLPVTTESEVKSRKYKIISEKNRDNFISNFLKAMGE